MKSEMISLFALIGCGMSAFADLPAAVKATWAEMKSAGIEQRAGYDKKLGVYVVAKGEAEITGSKAKAPPTRKTTYGIRSVLNFFLITVPKSVGLRANQKPLIKKKNGTAQADRR